MNHSIRYLALSAILALLVSCGSKRDYSSRSDAPIDSIRVDGYKLTFYKEDSFEVDDMYGDSGHRRKLTDTIANEYHQALAIQTYLAKESGEYFFLTDSTLVVRLAHDATRSYPKWDEQHGEGFIFQHYFDDIGYYLLRVQWEEGNRWMLVNRQTGYQKYINGVPYVSPNGKRILSINMDLDAAYSFNGMELYTISGDTLKREFVQGTEWGPTDVKWVSEESFLLRREFRSFDTIQYIQKNKVDYTWVKIEKKKKR